LEKRSGQGLSGFQEFAPYQTGCLPGFADVIGMKEKKQTGQKT